ncbi:MAG: glutamate-1-semialdehyde 2,1-aminomutase [Opitutales bacterium]|nr:glutamate-1-semialdehyde 2,1-aminomutase [Opitutales bacterium]
MNLSEQLFARAQKSIPGGVNSPVRAFRSVGGTPFTTQSAQGAVLTTADGAQLIDFVCTWGPAIHGHNNEAIRNAIAEALNKGTSFGTPNVYEVEMAELVKDCFPSIDKVRMVNSGTEATMSCIRLARGYTGRNKIIKFEGCYHGHVDSLLIKAGSGALTLGNPDSAGIPESFAQETIILPYNDKDALADAFRRWGKEIAGVIVEAYPANCGLILPREGYMEYLRDICTEYGSVFIMDEVMTGFRVSRGGVQEKHGITPDLTALGKVIGGGLPVGAFGGKEEIMNYIAPLGPVYQAGTLSGNPLAMAAGIRAIQLLHQEHLYSHLESATRYLCESVSNAAKKRGIALQTPHTCSMFGLYFTTERVDRFDQAQHTDTNKFAQLFRYCLEHGVFLPPSAYETCFLSTAHTPEVIEQATQVICEGIHTL